ncbi:MAG: type II toxin-antitoxin system HicA family toxin [Patescibacteria group bacterium]|nr:type II toxin-antitoxin system HicA family toxin [Patescibacteria group bacterium]
MPSLSGLPGFLSRKKLVKALRRVGFEVNTIGGKGSHVKLIWPKTQKTITIPAGVEKQTLQYVLKEIEKYSGVTWEEIQREL